MILKKTLSIYHIVFILTNIGDVARLLQADRSLIGDVCRLPSDRRWSASLIQLSRLRHLVCANRHQIDHKSSHLLFYPFLTQISYIT